MDVMRAFNALRVAELKVLCQEEGLDHRGSKSDLIKRIVQHRQDQHGTDGTEQAAAAPEPAARVPSTPPVRSGRSKASGSSSEGKRGRARGAGRSAGRGQSTPTSEREASNKGRGRAGGRGRRCVADSGVEVVGGFSCTQCASSCGKDSQSPSNAQMCVECRVRVMDPFRPVEGSRGILYSCQIVRKTVDFSVNMPELRQWRRDGLQIQVRMVRLDETNVCHVWPRTLTFSVNNKQVFEVVPPEEGHKRRDVPIDVSAGFAQGPNVVNLIVDDSCYDKFALALVLTSHREVEDLAKDVTSCSLENARARVRGVLAKMQSEGGSGEGDIVCLTTNKLKLLCPITMEKVTDPVRGEHCQHLQCFELTAYLTSNHKMGAFNRRWTCPVCSLILRPTQLRRDKYVQSILKATADDMEDVTILPDGTWKTSTACSSSAPLPGSAPAACIEQCSVDLDDGDEEAPLLSLLTQPEPSESHSEARSKSQKGNVGKRPRPQFKQKVLDAFVKTGQTISDPLSSSGKKVSKRLRVSSTPDTTPATCVATPQGSRSELQFAFPQTAFSTHDASSDAIVLD